MSTSLCSIAEISEAIISGLSGALGKGYPILYNSIGVISIFLQFMIYQMRSKKGIVVLGIFSNIGWLSYFALQGDLISGTSGVIGIMSKIIILLSANHHWAKSKWWNILFVAVAGAYSSFTFKGIIDIFALTASLLSITSYFMKKPNDVRKVALFAYCAYVCNSISKLYVVALIADVTALISVIISLIRYKDEKDEEQESAEEQN